MLIDFIAAVKVAEYSYGSLQAIDSFHLRHVPISTAKSSHVGRIREAKMYIREKVTTQSNTASSARGDRTEIIPWI